MLFGLMAKPEFLPSMQSCRKLAEASLPYSLDPQFAGALTGALNAWIRQTMRAAADYLGNFPIDHPRSVFVRKLEHQIRFMLGDSRGMERAIRSLCEAQIAIPWHSHTFGLLAFSLEELGEYQEARVWADRAVEGDPMDVWAVHSISHCFEMANLPEEGLKWSTETKDRFQNCNNFRFHLEWHHGLFLIDLLRFDEALETYDRRIRAERTDDFRDFANASSLLYRLHTKGVNLGNRWRELQELAHQRSQDKCLVFLMLHQLLVFLANQDQSGIDQMLASLDDLSLAPHEQGQSAKEVGVPLARTLVALLNRQELNLQPILAALSNISLLGGSHAQRDVFFEALVYGLGMADMSHEVPSILKVREDLAKGAFADINFR